MSIDKIQRIIDKEVESAVKSIKSTNKYLSKTNVELNTKINLLEQEIKALQKGDLFSKYTNNVNKENLTEFLTFIFTNVTNEAYNNQITKAPEWFYNIVRYWEYKDTLLNLYDLLGIKYDRWILNFKMPYEWNQKQCDLFIKYLGNQYVCNGAIFDNNYGFWLKECANKSIEDNIKKQYSEIPWQLVLKNPLWLEDENFNKILKVVNDRNHGSYFTAIYNYQLLSQNQIELIIDKLITNPDIKKWDYTVAISFRNLISKLNNGSNLWDKLENNNLVGSRDVPERIWKARIIKEPNSIGKLQRMQNKNNLFNEAEFNEVLNTIKFES